MLKLNKLNEDDLSYDLSSRPKAIKNWTPVINDDDEPIEEKVRAAFNLTSWYVRLANANYGLENYDQVKPYLEKAAPYAFLRGFDEELKTHKNDWTIQQELNLCLLFGNTDIIEKLSKLVNNFKPSSIMHQACYLYDCLLIKVGTGQSIEQVQIEEALSEAGATKDKDVLQYIQPLIQAINALVLSDQSLWQSSIEKAIDWHTDQCKFGDYKEDIDGFINLNALTLAKLGKTMHGWQCETHSLYLPLFLID
ncbi:immunity 49 family protein [Catenovulum sp. SM1970]|uniref:Imm49 family immunity protein n=1 Tax=Marinifaba aquimaris TaxID=2741323 RepID=UPI001574D696|nr:Imm49 family immunity protein [Marinifaba aquimaris]NTS77895.1 immunity 49 family protein [Marinifaba aquimaris]